MKVTTGLWLLISWVLTGFQSTSVTFLVEKRWMVRSVPTTSEKYTSSMQAQRPASGSRVFRILIQLRIKGAQSRLHPRLHLRMLRWLRSIRIVPVRCRTFLTVNCSLRFLMFAIQSSVPTRPKTLPRARRMTQSLACHSTRMAPSRCTTLPPMRRLVVPFKTNASRVPRQPAIAST